MAQVDKKDGGTAPHQAAPHLQQTLDAYNRHVTAATAPPQYEQRRQREALEKGYTPQQQQHWYLTQQQPQHQQLDASSATQHKAAGPAAAQHPDNPPSLEPKTSAQWHTAAADATWEDVDDELVILTSAPRLVENKKKRAGTEVAGGKGGGHGAGSGERLVVAAVRKGEKGKRNRDEEVEQTGDTPRKARLSPYRGVIPVHGTGIYQAVYTDSNARDGSFLGNYVGETAAAKAYDHFAVARRGIFAHGLNFPMETLGPKPKPVSPKVLLAAILELQKKEEEAAVKKGQEEDMDADDEAEEAEEEEEEGETDKNESEDNEECHSPSRIKKRQGEKRGLGPLFKTPEIGPSRMAF